MKRLILLSFLMLLAAPATAQQFPTKPINMIVVFAAGGATDVLARIAADHMSNTLGQRVVVENVTGAGGTIGGARGAQAAPDGYTLTVGSMGSHSAAPTIYASSIKYNPLELEPVGLIGGTPLYLTVRNDFPAKTFQEFAAYVKANPGKVSLGHAGVGSTNHLASLLLMHLTGLNFNLIAYRGEGPAVADLVAGHIDSGGIFAPAAVPQIKANKVRALLIAQNDRATVTPDVPTSKEAGVEQFLLQGWSAVFAPKGTPKPVIAKLSEALRSAVADPAVRKRIEELGAIPATGETATPEYLGRMLKSDIERWSLVIKAAGVSEPPPN
ncbi:MAG TPA: tripartite tricarboxylate transporter substrate-binding protein [Candidatus Binatia bacterium]|nr:tripartite tricarboxylate transporter substrate-binding protein [Candidatus Binatia bacterium]